MVGYALTSDDQKILNAGFVPIHKCVSLKEKAHCVLEHLVNKNIGLVTDIIIEDSLGGFQSGRTSQQTVIKLAKCNAVVSYVVGEYYNIEPTGINVSTMRKKVFGKSREKGLDSKEFVKCNIDNMLDLSDFIHYNSKNNYDKKNYDMLDAVVASLYHWYSLK